jgi:prefoldin subunit 1
MVPRKTMEGELKAQEKELSDDITSLNKKVSALSKSYSRYLLILVVRQNS